MASKENIGAAKALVTRYRGVTLDEIIDLWVGNDSNDAKTANHLTGYGNNWTCSLCRTAKGLTCRNCVHAATGDCISGESEDSYYAIQFAGTPDALLVAFRARADYLEGVIAKVKAEQ